MTVTDEDLDMLRRIAEFTGRQKASFALHHQDGEWTVGLFFGEEEPGSSMWGGAAHGVGDSLTEALQGVAAECRI